ncbi:hypothetical protein AVEN_187829-1 [Araneus ventricosus]|uniref:Uncharacterized protein n=1 Tax=Araneus ventricosus TaxID=182803 RepID=A0A4Y2KM84_ARAVE|nr:hypothetical protein AVEN_187829-1 [Araneus ventricosus]
MRADVGWTTIFGSHPPGRFVSIIGASTNPCDKNLIHFETLDTVPCFENASSIPLSLRGFLPFCRFAFTERLVKLPATVHFQFCPARRMEADG